MPTKVLTPIKTTQYVYTADEMVRIYQLCIRWRNYWLLVFCFGGGLVIAAVQYYGKPTNVMIAVGFTLAVGMLYVYAQISQIRRWHRRAVANGSLIPQYHEFDSDTLTTYVADGGMSRKKLVDFVAAVWDSQALFLYREPKDSVMIPWHVFPPDIDLHVLEELLRAKMEVLSKHSKVKWATEIPVRGGTQPPVLAFPGLDTTDMGSEAISTNEFTLTREQYTSVMYIHMKDANIFLLVLAGIVLLIFLTVPIGMGIAFLIPLSMMLLNYLSGSYVIKKRWDSLEAIGSFSIPQQHIINRQFLVTLLQDGTYTKRLLEHWFVKLEKFDDTYVLRSHIPRTSVVIPASAFATEDDRQRFERLMGEISTTRFIKRLESSSI